MSLRTVPADTSARREEITVSSWSNASSSVQRTVCAKRLRQVSGAALDCKMVAMAWYRDGAEEEEVARERCVRVASAAAD